MVAQDGAQQGKKKTRNGAAKSTKTDVHCGNHSWESKVECNRALSVYTFARTTLKLAKQKKI